MKRWLAIVLILGLVGCVSAETRQALEQATERVARVERMTGDLRAERDALLLKFEQGKINLEKFEKEREKIFVKLAGIELEGELAKTELEVVKKKADLERETSVEGILSGVDTTLEIGGEVAAGIPSLGFLIPILGLIRLGIGAFRKKKNGGSDA